MNHLYFLYVRAIEKAKVVRSQLFVVSFLLLPFVGPMFAPPQDIESLAKKLVGYVAIAIGGIVLYVGGRVLIGGAGFWKALLEVIGLTLAAGLLVEGGLRVFTGNSLGTVVYNLLANELGG